jgi:hypothetical protein
LDELFLLVEVNKLIDVVKVTSLEPENIVTRELALIISYMQGIIKSHHELKTRLPNIIFENKLTIHGTNRTIELIPLAGHTESDVILNMPKEKSSSWATCYLSKCTPI